MIEDIQIFDNFLTLDQCQILVNEAKLADSNLWESTGNYKNFKSSNFDLLRDINKKIVNLIDNKYYVQIIRMIHKTDIDSSWQFHSDDEGGRDIMYGVVIYLNDNFSGGDTVYRDLGYQVVPKTGTMIIHPANKTFTHSVSKVYSGDRYTLTTFLRNKNVHN